MNHILGVSSPLQYIVMLLINKFIFSVFYDFPVISKTTNVNQYNTHRIKRIAISVPDAYPPTLYYLRVVLRHSVDTMWK